MAKDEPKRDDQPTDTVDADTPEVAPDTPQEREPIEELPDEYKGKSPAELVKILQDKEDFINQQGGEVGTLRGKVGDLENQVAYNTQFAPKEPAQPQAETPPTAAPSDEDYPTWGELRKINEQGIRQDTMIRGQIQMAKPFIEQAKKEAPQRFQGITDEELTGAAYQYLSRGQLHPMSLSNPRTWKMAATWIQGEKTDYNFTTTPIVAEPVEPVDTAIPSQNRPEVSEGEIPISEENRAYAREVLGMKNPSDDEIRNIIEAGIDTQRTGVTK